MSGGTNVYFEEVTVGTTRVNPAAKPVPLNHLVLAKAKWNNTGTVFVKEKNGDNTVAGYPLRPDVDVPLEIQDASQVGFISDTAGQKVIIMFVI